MPWIAPLIAGAASIGGSAMAAGAQNNATRQAAELAQQSVRDLEAIGIPTIEAQKIVLEQYQSQGQYTPELEEAIKLGDSNMLGVATDPNSRAAQMQALNKLREISDAGGMSLEDQAVLQKTMGNIESANRGRREAILQDAQQRGGYGSGTALAAQLMAGQEAAQQANQAGLQSAGSAQARALQAIQAAGTLGGQINTQDFNQQSEKARAQDAINQWNAANSQQVAAANAQAKNLGQQYNLGNAQTLANQNVDTRNKQETYNKGLYQQQYQNELQKATAAANARAGQATQITNAGQNAASLWSGVGSGISQGALAYGNMQNANDQRKLDRDAYGSAYFGRPVTKVNASNDDDNLFANFG